MNGASDRGRHELGLIRLNQRVTAGFALAAIATHFASGSLDLMFAATSTALSAVGVVFALLGFWNGVQRSRVDEVSLAGLLAVDKSFVPRSARNSIWIANGSQILIAFTAAILRPFTQQVFALLVPMFGVGIATLWGSRFALFHPRDGR